MSTRSAYGNALFEVITPIIAGLVVVLNLLEVAFILKGRRTQRKTLVDVYILNLSISDIVVGIVMIALKSMHPFMKTSLKGNVVAEEIFQVIQHCVIRLSIFISVFNLIVLTIDRVWAIRKPFSHRSRCGKSFAIKACIGVWVFATVCSTLIYCISRFFLKDVGRYNGLIFPIATYTAIIVFVISYGMIYQTIKNSRLTMRKSTTSKSTIKEYNKNDVQEIKENKVEMKFLQLAAKTVISFVVCWFPFSTCNLVKATGYSCGSKDVISTLFTLAFFNSILNPFVYFQHVWSEIFMCLGRRRKPSGTSLTSGKTSKSDISLSDM